MSAPKKTELLAPAGDLATLRAVIRAGADAVYCGGDRFGARAYAKNFTAEELLCGIDFAHLNGARVYLTVNTCLKDEELLSLPEYLAPFYEAGLDAVLVQDFGVLSELRRCFPALPIHASTQMSICTAEGVAFLAQCGIRRVVMARELSLSELRQIASHTDVELECFVHGALCYAYSGLCLMSSMLGGRSGNRGRCAGTCRLPFKVSGEKEPCYPLSLKDLCTVDFLPELLDCGIVSFKIEGRMKSPEYASGVTSIYRKYLDLAEAGDASRYLVSDADRQALLSLGNRSGFTKGFYFTHNDPDMVTLRSPHHTKAPDEGLMAMYGHFLTHQPLPVTGNAVLYTGEAARLTVKCREKELTVYGETGIPAKSRPLDADFIREKLLRTGDTEFSFTELSVEASPDLFLPVGKLNELRRSALRQLREALLADFRREAVRPERSVRAEDKSPRRDFSELPPATVTAQVSRREQLAAVLTAEQVDTVILDSLLYTREDLQGGRVRSDLMQCIKKQKKVLFAFPYVLRQESAHFFESIREDFFALPFDGMVARNYDTLGLLKKLSYPADRVLLDERLYTYSVSASDAFFSCGYGRQTLPVELNEAELIRRNRSGSELIIYGRLPLMITANCVHRTIRGCDRKNATETLTDRYQKTFPVRCDCTDCCNLIYNADVLDLREDTARLRRIAPVSLRYLFADETEEETKAILRGEILPGQCRTRGHMKRGVE